MAFDQPPILKKVDLTDVDTLEVIKLIDTRLQNIQDLEVVSNRENESSLGELVDSLYKFQKEIKKDNDLKNLSDKSLLKYQEIQNKNFKKLSQSIEDSFDDYREAILSKDKITEKDKAFLANLEQIEKTFEYQNKLIIGDNINSLRKKIENLSDTYDEKNIQGLSKEDKQLYIEQQQKKFDKDSEDLKDELNDLKQDILKKEKLSEEDKETLVEISKLQKIMVEKTEENTTVFSRKFEKFSDEFGKGFSQGKDEMVDTVARGLLGPLNLIFEPLSNLFDFHISNLFGMLFDKEGKEYTKKGKKIKPRRGDLLKSNPEQVYVVDEIKKLYKKANDDADDGSFGSALLGGALTPMLSSLIAAIAPLILPALGIALGIGGLAALIIAMVKDTKQRNKESKELMDATGLTEEDIAAQHGNRMKENVVASAYERDKSLVSAEEAYEATGKIVGTSAASETSAKVFAETQKELSITKPWKVEKAFAISKRGKDYFIEGSDIPLTDAEKNEIMSPSRAAFANNTQERLDATNFDEYFNYVMQKPGKSLYKFHNGGLAPGNNNDETISILKAKERVLTPKQDTSFSKVLSKLEKNFDMVDMSSTLNSLKSSIETSSKGDEIVENLKVLISTIKNKPFNNIISSQQPTINFNELRGVLQ